MIQMISLMATCAMGLVRTNVNAAGELDAQVNADAAGELDAETASVRRDQEHLTGPELWQQWAHDGGLTQRGGPAFGAGGTRDFYAASRGWAVYRKDQQLVGIAYNGMSGRMPSDTGYGGTKLGQGTTRKTALWNQHLEVTLECPSAQSTIPGLDMSKKTLEFDSHFAGNDLDGTKGKPYAGHIENDKVHVLYEKASTTTLRPSAKRSYRLSGEVLNCPELKYTIEQQVETPTGELKGRYAFGSGVATNVQMPPDGVLAFQFTQDCAKLEDLLEAPAMSEWNCAPGKKGMFLITGHSDNQQAVAQDGTEWNSRMAGSSQDTFAGSRLVFYLQKAGGKDQSPALSGPAAAVEQPPQQAEEVAFQQWKAVRARRAGGEDQAASKEQAFYAAYRAANPTSSHSSSSDARYVASSGASRHAAAQLAASGPRNSE